MKTPLALVLAGALALAGCLSEAPVESASANGASASATATGAEADAAASADADGASATRAIVPFREEGSTFNGAAVCGPPTGCVGSGLPGSGDATNWFEPALSGTLDEADLTLTWSAASPLTEELLLGIAYETEEGATDFIVVTGASPLTLAEKDLGIPAQSVQGVYVNAFKCNGALVVWGCASSEQPFNIEGTLVTTTGA